LGQYYFARWRLLSVAVCNAAGGPAAVRVGGRAMQPYVKLLFSEPELAFTFAI